MADEENTTDRAPRPFELLRRCDEVGPGLGRLYEARNVKTGSPALVFFPGDRVEWKPEGPWQTRFHYHPDPVCLTLDLEQAPDATDAADVVDSLVLMSAASQRAEDNPRFQAHFARRPEPRERRWSTRQAVVGGITVFALGLGTGCLSVNLWGLHSPPDVSQEEAPAYSSQRETAAAVITYPMPPRPFKRQALPPCVVSSEVEINGGCWATLEQKPPCGANYAEHQGKCYIPVHKKDPLPQSQQP